MLLMSCQTTAEISDPVIPQLVFPEFPVLENAVKNTDGTVTISGEWLLRLAEYKIRIEETEKTYTEIKALYEGEEK